MQHLRAITMKTKIKILIRGTGVKLTTRIWFRKRRKRLRRNSLNRWINTAESEDLYVIQIIRRSLFTRMDNTQ